VDLLARNLQRILAAFWSPLTTETCTFSATVARASPESERGSHLHIQRGVWGYGAMCKPFSTANRCGKSSACQSYPHQAAGRTGDWLVGPLGAGTQGGRCWRSAWGTGQHIPAAPRSEQQSLAASRMMRLVLTAP